MQAVDRVLEEVSDFTRLNGQSQNSFLLQLKLDIDRFVEQTKNLQKQMEWQGYTTLTLTSFGASLAVAGALIPKASPGAEQLPNMRMNANAGMSDPLSNILKKLSDDQFLRTTCKTTSKFFTEGLNRFSESWFSSTRTDIEGKRSLIERVSLQEAQGMRGQTDSNVQTAQTAVLRILDSKSKGG